MKGTARRILVVDDEAHSRNALRELLGDEGYDVEVVADGMAAWEQLPAFHPDLVLSDVEMPRMGGLELADLMHADPDGPALVLMSSHLRPPRAHTPFVPKPIALGELLETVERALDARGRKK